MLSKDQKNDFVKINSANQFEIRAKYLTDSKQKKKIDYTIGIYMFIPRSLNINSTTYSKTDFYGDFVSYIRLITPRNNLEAIDSRISATVESIKEGMEDEKKIKKLSSRLKVLLCSYVTYLRHFVRDMEQQEIDVVQIRSLLERIRILQKRRDDILSLKPHTSDDKLLFLLDSSAEYMSRTTQHYLFEINIYLSSFGDKYEELMGDIIKHINVELQFCKAQGYPVISDDEYNNEKVIFRSSFLKKFFYDVLFLYQSKKEDGKGMKEIYYAVAAGISMIFTTLVVFFTQKQYGNFTMSFFAALVISYMFKDRIKEAYRHYFDKKLQFKTFDYKESIYDPSKKSIFAFTRERLRFVDKSTLSEDIIKTRLIGTPDRLSSWYTDENILRYGKLISLYSNNLQKHYNNRVGGMHNIMRFDISKLLRKMDNRKVPLYRVEGDRVYGDKVYHLNLVVSFESKEKKVLHKIRVVLTKKGIKRIEMPEFDIKIVRPNSKTKRSWFAIKKSYFSPSGSI